MDSTSHSTGMKEQDNELDARYGEWLKEIATGDEDALEAFYTATLGKVYGVALRIIRDASMAEDIVTDVYYQVWNEAKRYDPARGRPMTWVLTICRSRALDHLRREGTSQRALDAVSSEAEQSAFPGPDDLLESLQSGTQIRKLLASLTPDQRHVISLSYFRDLSHQQIADHLNLPLGTVKTHIRKALQELRFTVTEQSMQPN